MTKSKPAGTDAVVFLSTKYMRQRGQDTLSHTMPMTDGTLVVFDVNLRQDFYNKEILCNSMERCNILKINDEELLP